MLTILIIGAGQGLGLEWVRYHKRQDHIVIATTRNLDSAIELKGLLKGEEENFST